MSLNKYPNQIVLKHPIQFGSEMVTVINYRRPKAKDMRGIDPQKLQMGDILDVFAKMSDQTPPVIDEMDCEDMVKAIEIFSGFLGVGQVTGN